MNGFLNYFCGMAGGSFSRKWLDEVCQAAIMVFGGSAWRKCLVEVTVEFVILSQGRNLWWLFPTLTHCRTASVALVQCTLRNGRRADAVA